MVLFHINALGKNALKMFAIICAYHQSTHLKYGHYYELMLCCYAEMMKYAGQFDPNICWNRQASWTALYPELGWRWLQCNSD